MPRNIERMDRKCFESQKAGNLRAKIVSEIQLGTFDYRGVFPESKVAAKFYASKNITTFAELASTGTKTIKSISPQCHKKLWDSCKNVNKTNWPRNAGCIYHQQRHSGLEKGITDWRD